MTWLRQDASSPSTCSCSKRRLNHFSRNTSSSVLSVRHGRFQIRATHSRGETHPLLVYNDVVCDNSTLFRLRVFEAAFSDVK